MIFHWACIKKTSRDCVYFSFRSWFSLCQHKDTLRGGQNSMCCIEQTSCNFGNKRDAELVRNVYGIRPGVCINYIDVTWPPWLKYQILHIAVTCQWHYGDVIISTIAPQITSLAIVYSTVYSDADKKNQSSASLAFVWGNHREPVNSPHKWPVTRKMFACDDVIMEKRWQSLLAIRLITSDTVECWKTVT